MKKYAVFRILDDGNLMIVSTPSTSLTKVLNQFFRIMSSKRANTNIQLLATVLNLLCCILFIAIYLLKS